MDTQTYEVQILVQDVSIDFIELPLIYIFLTATREWASERWKGDVGTPAPRAAFSPEAHYSRMVQTVPDPPRRISAQETLSSRGQVDRNRQQNHIPQQSGLEHSVTCCSQSYPLQSAFCPVVHFEAKFYGIVPLRFDQEQLQCTTAKREHLSFLCKV